MPVSNTSDLYLKVYSVAYKGTISIIKQNKSQAEHNNRLFSIRLPYSERITNLEILETSCDTFQEY